MSMLIFGYIAQYSPYYLPVYVLLLPKDQPFIFCLLLLQVMLCRVAALKSFPVHHPLCRLYFYLGPLRSVKIFRVLKTLAFRNILLSNI